jgi:hypothetical protein
MSPQSTIGVAMSPLHAQNDKNNPDKKFRKYQKNKNKKLYFYFYFSEFFV